jgi:hypothetical protein
VRLLGSQPKDDVLEIRIDRANGAEGNAAATAPEAVSKANDELIGMISMVGVAKMLDDAEGAALRAENLVAVGSGKEAAKLAFPNVHVPRIGVGSDGSVASSVRPVRRFHVASQAKRRGDTKRTVQRYTDRPDFPQPLGQVASGHVWLRANVEAWGKANLPLPTGRPRKGPDR